MKEIQLRVLEQHLIYSSLTNVSIQAYEDIIHYKQFSNKLMQDNKKETSPDSKEEQEYQSLKDSQISKKSNENKDNELTLDQQKKDSKEKKVQTDEQKQKQKELIKKQQLKVSGVKQEKQEKKQEQKKQNQPTFTFGDRKPDFGSTNTNSHPFSNTSPFPTNSFGAPSILFNNSQSLQSRSNPCNPINYPQPPSHPFGFTSNSSQPKSQFSQTLFTALNQLNKSSLSSSSTFGISNSSSNLQKKQQQNKPISFGNAASSSTTPLVKSQTQDKQPSQTVLNPQPILLNQQLGQQQKKQQASNHLFNQKNVQPSQTSNLQPNQLLNQQNKQSNIISNPKISNLFPSFSSQPTFLSNPPGIQIPMPKPIQQPIQQPIPQPIIQPSASSNTTNNDILQRLTKLQNQSKQNQDKYKNLKQEFEKYKRENPTKKDIDELKKKHEQLKKQYDDMKNSINQFKNKANAGSSSFNPFQNNNKSNNNNLFGNNNNNNNNNMLNNNRNNLFAQINNNNSISSNNYTSFNPFAQNNNIPKNNMFNNNNNSTNNLIQNPTNTTNFPNVTAASISPANVTNQTDANIRQIKQSINKIHQNMDNNNVRMTQMIKQHNQSITNALNCVVNQGFGRITKQIKQMFMNQSTPNSNNQNNLNNQSRPNSNNQSPPFNFNNRPSPNLNNGNPWANINNQNYNRYPVFPQPNNTFKNNNFNNSLQNSSWPSLNNQIPPPTFANFTNTNNNSYNQSNFSNSLNSSRASQNSGQQLNRIMINGYQVTYKIKEDGHIVDLCIENQFGKVEVLSQLNLFTNLEAMCSHIHITKDCCAVNDLGLEQHYCRLTSYNFMDYKNKSVLGKAEIKEKVQRIAVQDQMNIQIEESTGNLIILMKSNNPNQNR